jgi:hypothetical protein
MKNENGFDSEKEFQVWLARKLTECGFKVFTDKKICELDSFRGDREKPDLLIFFNKNFNENKVLKIKSPIAIEIKYNGGSNKFANISKSILQIKKYKNKKYYTDDWNGEINNIFLSTDDLIFKNKIYDWYVAKEFGSDKDFHNGMYWTLIRILSTVSNQSGFLNYNGGNFVIETPNSSFFLLDGGDIGYCPSKWNPDGRRNYGDRINYYEENNNGA